MDPHRKEALDPSWRQEVRFRWWSIPDQNGRFVALAEPFDIVGLGVSPEAAHNEMVELLVDYFGMIAGEGGSIEDAYRPISRTRKLSLQARWLQGLVAHRARRTRSAVDDIAAPHARLC